MSQRIDIFLKINTTNDNSTLLNISTFALRKPNNDIENNDCSNALNILSNNFFFVSKTYSVFYEFHVWINYQILLFFNN